MAKHAKQDEPPDRGEYTTRHQQNLAQALAAEYLAEEFQAGRATGPLQAFVAGYKAAKGEEHGGAPDAEKA